MIVDGRTVPENDTLDVDICIVGAGVAGLTLAHELAGQAIQVCLLESGDLSFQPETQKLCEGENGGHPYFPLDDARARVFGGTSNFWDIDTDRGLSARIRPLDPIDFEKRDWVPFSGWPLTVDDLRPYYDRAQELLDVGPPSFEPADWDGGDPGPDTQLDGDRMETIVYKFASQEIFNRDLRHEMKYQADNIITLLFSNVTEVHTDETGGHVSRVRVACLGGARFWVGAKLFVLAAGGIEIPRLLLLSNRTHKNGLGNHHDLVGRFFMEHVHTWSGVWLPSRPDFIHSIPGYRDVRSIRGMPILRKLALREHVQRDEGLLNQNIQLVPRTVHRTALFPRGESRTPGAKVVSLYRRMRRGLERRLDRPRLDVLRLANMSEQVPNPESRVGLTDEVDALGLRKVRLNWQLTSLDIESICRTQKILDREIRARGLGRVVGRLLDDTPPSDVHGGYHHMGTTRMHASPRQGVVDQDSRVHGVSNLYIAGPSVFPTGGYANPVLTITALSIRLADQLKSIASRWDGPVEVGSVGPVRTAPTVSTEGND